MSDSRNLGVIVTASLAGLLFGFDTVVISGVTESVARTFHLAPGSFWYGFSVASALLGTFIAGHFHLPELLMVSVEGRAFPVLWSIIGAALFVALIHLIGGRRRLRTYG